MSTQRLGKFRDLFAQEAEARLDRIHKLLLQIDDAESGSDVVGEIFREVHTIKGSAAVVGFTDLSQFAHGLEERLDDLRAGRSVLTPAIVDVLLAGADDLGRLIAASLSGDDVASMVRALDARDLSHATGDDDPVTRNESGVASIATEAPFVSDTPAVRRASTSVASRTSIQVPVERLDELVRLVGEAASANLRVGRIIHERLGSDAAHSTEFVALSRLLNDLQERAMRTRMVPLSTITDQLRRAVRDISRAVGKDVRWEVDGGDTELDRSVLSQLADSLLHVVRNAVDHGIESPSEREASGKPGYGTVHLHAMQVGSEVIIAVKDDGRGIDVGRLRATAARQGLDVDDLDDDEALQLVFRSGISTARLLTDISGRGVGLDVVRASVESARGRIEITSQPGVGTELRLIVPITLAVLPCLLVETGQQRFALPLHRVVVVHDRSVTTTHAEGRRVIWVEGKPVPVTALGEVLGNPADGGSAGPIVVVTGTLHQHAFQVDSFVGQRDVVVKGVSPVLPRLDLVAGASVDPDGSVLIVLDPPGLVDRARLSMSRSSLITPSDAAPSRRVRHILVVDDALTVRELQRSILERAGYSVSVAADGIEALALLSAGDVELVLTDLQMPGMDGIALTRAIREHDTLTNIPVVIVTSLSSDHDRQQGLDAGADGYIVKSSFDEKSLLGLVERMLGSGL